MSQPRLHVFESFGVELEFMIVHKQTLEVLPLVESLFRQISPGNPKITNRDIITWAPKSMPHVFELRSTQPEANFNTLAHTFADEIGLINKWLSGKDGMLLPTAMHPFLTIPEAQKWSTVHAASSFFHPTPLPYQHAWLNSQSTQLSLPFFNDGEFAKLHTALRLLLPIIPALCASSPVVEGAITPRMSNRLFYYEEARKNRPAAVGKFIPEAVFSERKYRSMILEPLEKEVGQSGTNLSQWNGRAAIPHFDRGSLEIKIMDGQECPAAELAIITLIIESLKALVDERWVTFEQQQKVGSEILSGILSETREAGRQAQIYTSEYPALFGMDDFSTAGQLWQKIHDRLLEEGNHPVSEYAPELEIMMTEGPLAERIVKSVGRNGSKDEIAMVYHKLSWCLNQNKIFVP
jgi:carboxylate-amine ligase